MLNKKVRDLMNVQVNKEMYSAYLYLDFSFYFGGRGLNGFASWYKKQAEEEMKHAEKFINYIHENGEKVDLLAIDKPNVALENDLDVLKAALSHEQYVTSLINTIYEAAVEVKEYKSVEFLNYFVDEQVEEEDNAEDLITKYELFGKDAASLYLLNKELGKRD